MKGHLYWTTAQRILRSLCEKHLASGTPGWEGVLKGGVYHLHKELGVGESVMWGEYYFVEALILPYDKCSLPEKPSINLGIPNKTASASSL